MGKCLNKICGYNRNSECIYRGDIYKCPNAIIEHTLSYAEEQLEHAKEQENKKGHPISADSKEENMSYARLVNKNIEMKTLLDNQKISIENYIKENEKLKEENKSLNIAAKELNLSASEATQQYLKVFDENQKLNENLKNKEMRIEFLECTAEKTKEKLENYELLKRMAKVLIEGL